jgi:hypothetical protein
MRTKKVLSDAMSNELLRQFLTTKAEYLLLHDLMQMLTEPDRKHEREEERFYVDKSVADGTLLQPEQKIKLNKFYDNTNQRWELIYKASRDRFHANAFHSCCNNKGLTMTVILSNNNSLLRGYTTTLWTSDVLGRVIQQYFYLL